jgi:hypothetical protein
MHNTQDNKIYIYNNNRFRLLAPGHHQVSLTGLDQSEGQDLVLYVHTTSTYKPTISLLINICLLRF